MSAKKNYADEVYLHPMAVSITPSASANGEVNSPVYEVLQGGWNLFLATITSLANGKKLEFRVQHSDSSSTGFANADTSGDVYPGEAPDPLTRTGVTGQTLRVKIGYWGLKRYVRIVVKSVDASPGATIRGVILEGALKLAPHNDA